MEEQPIIDRLKWIGIAMLVVFPLLFLGGFHVVGPFSARMIVAYGLLAYTIWRGSTDYLPTRGIQMYFVFIIVYVVINIFNLTAFEARFIKDLVAIHFVCCIAAFAFPRLFKSELSIQSAWMVIAFGFLLDAVVTILQYNNSPMGWTIGMYLNPIDFEEAEARASLGDANEFRKSILAGIMGRATGNGYFIATMLPIVTYFVWDRLKLKSLWTYAMFALAGICIYYIQQRMALAVAVAYLFSIILLKKTSPTTKILASSIAIIVLAFSLNYLQGLDLSRMGRLASTEDELRSSTFTVLGDFLSDPQKVLLGYNQIASEEDKTMFLILGHNAFTAALRLGGVFLLLTFIVLFFYLCRTLVEILLFSRREDDYRTMGMAVGCFCYLLYSQTHSTGVQSGSIMFWVMYMLTLQSHRIKYEAIEAEENEEKALEETKEYQNT